MTEFGVPRLTDNLSLLINNNSRAVGPGGCTHDERMTSLAALGLPLTCAVPRGPPSDLLGHTQPLTRYVTDPAPLTVLPATVTPCRHVFSSRHAVLRLLYRA